MNSPERISGLHSDPATLAGHGHAAMLDGFSVARIYATFHLRRGDYFPAGLDDRAFEMLVDLYLYDWLNRRVDDPEPAGIRLDGPADQDPGVEALIGCGLASVTRSAGPEASATLSLSRNGRARLDDYFEHMAGYIAAI